MENLKTTTGAVKVVNFKVLFIAWDICTAKFYGLEVEVKFIHKTSKFGKILVWYIYIYIFNWIFVSNYNLSENKNYFIQLLTSHIPIPYQTRQVKIYSVFFFFPGIE